MAWPRLKAQCFGAWLWMDLLSHDSQPERSTIKKSVTVRCLRKKPVTKCNSKQRLREDFCLQVEKTSRSLFQEVPAGKTPPSRSLLWQSSCYASAASSTFIHTFYHDLMHSWIHSTSVTSSEKNLFLMTQLSSCNFYWTILQCAILFYLVKRTNEFCFRKMKWQNIWKWTAFLRHDFPLQRRAGEFFAFISKFSCYLLLSWPFLRLWHSLYQMINSNFTRYGTVPNSICRRLQVISKPNLKEEELLFLLYKWKSIHSKHLSSKLFNSCLFIFRIRTSNKQ